jgi:hypothetical protein
VYKENGIGVGLPDGLGEEFAAWYEPLEMEAPPSPGDGDEWDLEALADWFGLVDDDAWDGI